MSKHTEIISMSVSIYLCIICPLHVYRLFIDSWSIYTLNTKTSHSWLTKPQTLKAKTKSFASNNPPLNCLWLDISIWSAKIIDKLRVDESIVDELKTSLLATVAAAWGGATDPLKMKEGGQWPPKNTTATATSYTVYTWYTFTVAG